MILYLVTHIEIFSKFQREKNNSEIRLILKVNTVITYEFVSRNSIIL